MSFMESPRFPERISLGAITGPSFSTDVVTLASGDEQRNANWEQGRGRYDVSHTPLTQEKHDALLAFFRRVKGRAFGFRFKDWADYTLSQADAGLRGLHGSVQVGGFAVGHGVPVYQVRKRYGGGSYLEDRDIRKPVAGRLTVYRNGTPVAVGAGAGQVAIDSATGRVTFGAHATRTVGAVAVGATTQVTLASALPATVVGDRLYLTGLAGADAALLNALSHPISNIAGAVYTLAANTAGKTITAGAGVAAAYPQADEALTVAGEFDVPARFDTDEARITIAERTPAGALYAWQGIPIVEIRARAL